MRLQLSAKASGFDPGDSVVLSVSSDGAVFTPVRTWADGDDDDGVYRLEDIDLSSFSMTAQFFISFDTDLSTPAAKLLVDDLEIVSQPLPSPLVESSDTKGPGSLLAEGSLIDGGAYTIEYFNDSGVELVSAVYGASGSSDETWVYVQAHKDYVVSATAGGSAVVAYIRQVPGTTEPTTGQRLYVETWRHHALEPPPPDEDDDGIESAVDGVLVGESFVDESQVFSGSFTDEHLGGASSGTIDDRGGLVITVTDAPQPGGFLIEASGGAGTATLTVCGSTVQLNDEDSVTATCGSVLIEVHAGTAEILLDDNIVAAVPGGATARITEDPEGRFTVENVLEGAPAIRVDILVGDDIEVTIPADSTAIMTIGQGGQVLIESGPDSAGTVIVRGPGRRVHARAGREHPSCWTGGLLEVRGRQRRRRV